MAGKKLNQAQAEGPQQDQNFDSFVESNQSFHALIRNRLNVSCQDQYSCSCWDTMMCANFTGHTGYCPIPIVLSGFGASLTSKGTIQEAQFGMEASLPEGGPRFSGTHTVPQEPRTQT